MAQSIAWRLEHDFMKANWQIWLLLALLQMVVVELRAQENDYSGMTITEIKAKATAGHAQAQLELAKCYKNGNGVEKSDVEAAKWCHKAAEQGVGSAELNLGTCYELGQGVQRDLGEAVKWYRKAAERGLPEAQCNLALCYLTGKGITASEQDAAKWLNSAAMQGNGLAQLNLGICCINGEGVAKNPVEAWKWITLAGNQGRQEAGRLLPDVERRMSPSQIAEAQRLVRSFKAIKESVTAAPAKAQQPSVNAEPIADLKSKAERGDASAQFNLGLRCHQGAGLPQDDAESAKWYR